MAEASGLQILYEFLGLGPGNQMVAGAVLHQHGGHGLAGIGAGVGGFQQLRGSFAQVHTQIFAFRHHSGVWMNLADTVGDGLGAHGFKPDRAELVDADLHGGLAGESLSLLAGECAVGHVHAHHGCQITAGAAAQDSDPVGIHAVLGSMGLDIPDGFPAVQRGSREPGLTAQAVFQRSHRVAPLDAQKIGIHVVIPLVTEGEAAAVDVHKQREGAVALVGQEQVKALLLAFRAVRHVKELTLHPADVRHRGHPAGRGTEAVVGAAHGGHTHRGFISERRHAHRGLIAEGRLSAHWREGRFLHFHYAASFTSLWTRTTLLGRFFRASRAMAASRMAPLTAYCR